jgi:four helix bundle protein
MAGYRDLKVWQCAVNLADQFYEVSKSWPRDEQFGMTSQARRAAVSVAANIAEGQGRSGRKEFRHHLSIAYGSLCELETLITLAHMRSYCDAATEKALQSASGEVARLLKGLMRSLEATTPPSTEV